MKYKVENLLPDHSEEGIEQYKRPRATITEWFVSAWYGGEKMGSDKIFERCDREFWGELRAKDIAWFEKYNGENL